MLQTKKIFSEHSNIERAQFRTYYPLTPVDLNTPGRKIIFKIDYADDFAERFQFFMKLEYVPKDSSKKYSAGSNIKLIDNFVAHLFSNIEVKKHGKTLSEVEFPGIVSTVRGYASYGGGHSENLCPVNSGFRSIYKGGNDGDISVLGNLGELTPGFFSDLTLPFYKGGFDIIFTRNQNEDALYRWKSSGATTDDTPVEGKIIIKDFCIRTEILYCEENDKTLLIDKLTHKDKYILEFNNWQCIQHKNISGKTLTFDITNIYRNIYNPVYGFVVFQTNASLNQLYNNADFENVKVQNAQFIINNKSYPEEPQNGEISIFYEDFTDFKQKFSSKNQPFPYIDLPLYKDRKFILAFDFTRQPDKDNNKSNIILKMEFLEPIKPPSGSNEGTIAYVILMSKTAYSYNINTNEMNEII